MLNLHILHFILCMIEIIEQLSYNTYNTLKSILRNKIAKPANPVLRSFGQLKLESTLLQVGPTTSKIRFRSKMNFDKNLQPDPFDSPKTTKMSKSLIIPAFWEFFEKPVFTYCTWEQAHTVIAIMKWMENLRHSPIYKK